MTDNKAPNKTADAFADLIAKQVQKFLAEKADKKRKKPALTLVKSGALDNELAARAKKLTQSTRERIDRYALWPEVRKVLWIGKQSCSCCNATTTFIGGIFVVVQDPKNAGTKIYLRRETENRLPISIEYDEKSQTVPFCVSCLNEITQPLDDETVQAMLQNNLQATLF